MQCLLGFMLKVSEKDIIWDTPNAELDPLEGVETKAEGSITFNKPATPGSEDAESIADSVAEHGAVNIHP
jgi:hypothetical protein